MRHPDAFLTKLFGEHRLTRQSPRVLVRVPRGRQRPHQQVEQGIARDHRHGLNPSSEIAVLTYHKRHLKSRRKLAGNNADGSRG